MRRLREQIRRAGGRLAIVLGLFSGLSGLSQTNVFPSFTVETARGYLEAVGRGLETQAVSGAEVCMIQARLQKQLGKDDLAEKWVRKAMEEDPTLPGTESFLADLLIGRERFDEARSWLRLALAKDPKTPAGQTRLGMVLDRQGKSEEAREAFEAAVKQDTDDATARLLLGRWLLDRNRADEAVGHLERACQVNTNAANAYYVLYQAHKKLGDTNRAQRAFEVFQEVKKREDTAEDKAHTRDNDTAMQDLAVEVHTTAARVFTRNGAMDTAEAHLKQAILIKPKEPRPREMLATFYLRSNQPSKARASFEELGRLWPSNTAYMLNRGTLDLQLGNQAEGVKALEQVLKQDPKDPQALGNLARAYLSKDRNLPEAESLCRRLVEAVPTAANYDLLGWALYAGGKTNEARSAVSKAIEIEPENPKYRQRLRQLGPKP